LPFAYRDYERADGTAVAISTTGPVDLAWTLQRSQGRWLLLSGHDDGAAVRISIPADVLWRLWTKGLTSQEARPRIQATGDEKSIEALTRFVAILA
jgi:hypothetical protein